MSLTNEFARVLVKTGWCRYFTIRKHGVQVRFFPTRISKRLWVDARTGRSKFDDMERFYLSFLRTGDRVIDVGANIGWYTLIAGRQVGETGEVYAFEAHPQTFDYLVRNLQINDIYNIRIFSSALGSQAGEVQFSDERKDDMNKVVSEGGLTVHMNRLDEFPINEGDVDLLKIDVEGFELFVLEGATKIIARTRVILLEVWENHMKPNGYGFADIYDLLDGAGFTLLKAHEGDYILVGRDHDASEFCDLIAVRDHAWFMDRMRG